MSTEADRYDGISFGRFLQRVRLARRIRLTEVAQQTKIRTEILAAIEKEDHAKLPAEPYLKGFLSAFAKAVGADTEEVLRRYDHNRRECDEVARDRYGLKKHRARDWLKLGSVLMLLLILATLSIYLMTLFTKGVAEMASKTISPKESAGEDSHRPGPPKEPNGVKETLSKGQNNPEGNVLGSAGGATVEGVPQTRPDEKRALRSTAKRGDTAALNSDGYLLSVQAVKNTWLKVIADDQAMVKYNLKTGDRLDLTAASRFNILIGNAEGVQLTLNDRPFPVSGKSGQIVNIEIP